MDSLRLEHLIRFYAVLDGLEREIGGARKLADCSGRMSWPLRGVYFFREYGEQRSDTGTGPRVIRVGTHALTERSRTELWTRLSQHKGQENTGGGKHRGSIFRLIVGTALIKRNTLSFPTWGVGNTARRPVREVSRAIRDMCFLWLPVLDEPGPSSRRGYIERNAIALLSNYRKPPFDPPSRDWLGRYADRERVRESGLWNQNHVDEVCDTAFLDTLDELVSNARRAA